MALFGAGIASYMSVADGNVSSGSSWALIDSVSIIDILATDNVSTLNDVGVINTTTTYQNTATWAYASSPPTIDGIAIRVSSIAGGGGTFTVALDLAGVDVTGTVCTVNVSDLPLVGWAFIKFSAPVTLTVATYSLKFKSSVSATVHIKNNNVSAICKFLRTTSTGTVPSAASVQRDNLYIIGEITGAGATTTRTITWDITSNAFPYNSLAIGNAAIVNAQNNASTNYYMYLQNDIRVYANATLNIGTSGTPLQSTSRFQIAFNIPTIGQLIAYPLSTINMYGSPKTLKTFLTADAAISATSITVNNSTGWAIGDKLSIATTSVTPSECEEVTISSISGTTIGVSALVAAHLGTSPKQAEVINLITNISIIGVGSNRGGLYCYIQSTVTLRYVEIFNCGTTTTNFTAITINTTTGTGNVDIQFCTVIVTPGYGVVFGPTQFTGTATFSNNITYNIGGPHITTSLATLTNLLTIDSNVFMYMSQSGTSIILWGLSGTANFTNNIIIGSSGSIASSAGGINLTAYGTLGTMTGNVIHGGPGYGIYVGSAQTTSAQMNWSLGNTTVWCMSRGIRFQNALYACAITIDGYTCFSNTVNDLEFNNQIVGQIYFNNFQCQAGTSPATPTSIYFTAGIANNVFPNLLITNSNFGDVSAHSTADFVFDKLTQITMLLQNCKLGSTTKVIGVSNLINNSYIGFDRYQQTNGNFLCYMPNGTITADTVIYNAASPSIRVTPNSASKKMQAGTFYIAIPDATTCTVTVKVRKSVSGDGATYNGNFPRLMLAANPQAGITSASVLATATIASAGAWETLTGTITGVTGDSLVQVYVDCDGTVGWINIDDLSSSQTASNQGGMSFSRGGQPLVVLGSGNGAGGTNTIVPFPVLRKKVV